MRHINFLLGAQIGGQKVYGVKKFMCFFRPQEKREGNGADTKKPYVHRHRVLRNSGFAAPRNSQEGPRADRRQYTPHRNYYINNLLRIIICNGRGLITQILYKTSKFFPPDFFDVMANSMKYRQNSSIPSEIS